jgi:hypothetical protein
VPNLPNPDLFVELMQLQQMHNKHLAFPECASYFGRRGSSNTDALVRVGGAGRCSGWLAESPRCTNGENA